MVKVLGYSVYLSCSLKVVLRLPIQGCQGVNSFYYVARMNGQISGCQIVSFFGFFFFLLFSYVFHSLFFLFFSPFVGFVRSVEGTIVNRYTAWYMAWKEKFNV